MRDISAEWLFRENRIAKENIGQHDADNRFLSKDIQIQLSTWRGSHPDCTPIGICYDKETENYGCYPMVYEDKNGNRFYTHCDIKSVEDYIEDVKRRENNA